MQERRSVAHRTSARNSSAIASAAFAVLLATGLTAGCARIGGEPFQPTLNTALVLGAGDRLGQTVHPAGPVTGVDLNVATFAGQADPDGVLTVTIARPGGAEVLARTEVMGADLTDGTWVAATFETPVHVDGVALVEATWDGADPIALWANTTQAGTDGVTNDPYAAGQLVVDGRPTSGDLAFRVVGDAGPAAGLAQLVEVVRSTAARALADPLFAIAWSLALAGAVAMSVRGLRSPRP